MENHPSDIQVQAHSNSIRSDKDVETIVRFIEQGCLMPSHFRWQSTIDHTAFVVCPPLDVCLDVEDVSPRESHYAVSRLDACIVPRQSARLDLQISKSVVVHDRQRLSHILAHLLDQRQGGSVTTEVYFICRQPLQSSSPGPAPLIIANHLHKKNTFVAAPKVDYWHSTSSMLAVAYHEGTDSAVVLYLQHVYTVSTQNKGELPHLYLVNDCTVPLLCSIDHLYGA